MTENPVSESVEYIKQKIWDIFSFVFQDSWYEGRLWQHYIRDKTLFKKYEYQSEYFQTEVETLLLCIKLRMHLLLGLLQSWEISLIWSSFLYQLFDTLKTDSIQIDPRCVSKVCKFIKFTFLTFLEQLHVL